MSQRNDYRRKQLETKHRLFKDMLTTITRDNASRTVEEESIAALQNAAVKRFESALTKVDQRLFETPDLAESRYSKTYTENRTAIENLMARIDGHDMTRVPVSEQGIVLNRKDHIRRMASAVQSDLALLAQEETMLGYMAKLVALDAMSLAEEGLDAELADSDVQPTALNPSQNVSFFLTN